MPVKIDSPRENTRNENNFFLFLFFFFYLLCTLTKNLIIQFRDSRCSKILLHVKRKRKKERKKRGPTNFPRD